MNPPADSPLELGRAHASPDLGLPDGRERHLRRLIPFCQPQTVKSGYKMGRGIVLILAVAANVDTTLDHILGRIPNWLLVLDAGTTYTPRWRRSTVTPWTTNTATVQFDTAVPLLSVWVI